MSYRLSGYRAIASVKNDGTSHAIALDTVDSVFDLYRCILPRQVRRLRRESPELNLLVALMINAINEYLGLEGSERDEDRARLRRTAELWFDGDPGARLSFERCCDLLGLDPNATQRAIKRLAALTSQGDGASEATAGKVLELDSLAS